MSASAFTPANSDGGPLDPTKSVRYVEGMVLGVDDFQQEHAYLSGLAGEALRLGVGVGTLWGLKVTVTKATDTGKTEVHVGPGAAIDNRGRLIRVSEEQCADLAAWIATQKAADIAGKVVTGGDLLKGTLPVQVTVGYSKIATDVVPVPGEPCRGDDRLTAASRWRDDFQLNLTLNAIPLPRLKEALRQYLTWIRYALTLDATPAPPTPVARNDLADSAGKLLLDCQAAAATAPGEPKRLLPASLPGTLAAVKINKDDLELQTLCQNAANVVFVSELLPTWLGPTPADGAAEALLLAELSIPVKKNAAADPWTFDAANLPKASSRARPVALDGLTLPAVIRGA